MVTQSDRGRSFFLKYTFYFIAELLTKRQPLKTSEVYSDDEEEEDDDDDKSSVKSDRSSRSSSFDEEEE